jgi:hypothetical protein
VAHKDRVAGRGRHDQIAIFCGLDRLWIGKSGENLPLDRFGDRNEVDDFANVVGYRPDLVLDQFDKRR